MQRLGVDPRLDQLRSENRFDLRSKNKPVANVRVIQRLDPDVIAHQRQRSLAIVPDGKRKHAVEPSQTFPTPLLDRGQQNFRIAVCFELMTQRAQLFAQFAVIVDFAVEGENETAVRREHRLVTGRSGIDDRKASMAQTGTAAGVVDRLGNPNAFVVTAAMLDRFEHWANQRLRLKAYDSSDTTHLDRSE